MPRVKGAPVKRRRHKNAIRLAKGAYGRRSTTFRAANQTVMKGLLHAFRDRRRRKREFRRLWITRINAAARQHGVSYSRLMGGMKKAGIAVNRKMLADLAVNDAGAFQAIVEAATKEA